MGAVGWWVHDQAVGRDAAAAARGGDGLRERAAGKTLHRAGRSTSKHHDQHGPDSQAGRADGGAGGCCLWCCQYVQGSQQASAIPIKDTMNKWSVSQSVGHPVSPQPSLRPVLPQAASVTLSAWLSVCCDR